MLLLPNREEAAARQQTKRFVAVQVIVATVQRKVIRRLSDRVSYQLRYFTSLALVMHDARYDSTA